MSTIRGGGSPIKRNDRCPCGSGSKFKACCSPAAPANANGRRSVRSGPVFVDTGEQAVRWLITDETTTKFFADKDNRAIVFKHQAEAIAVAGLQEFDTQEPGDINVAGVGETKWQHLQAKIPFVEVEDVEHAVALVRERIEYGKAGELTEAKPLDLNDVQKEGCDAVCDGGHDNPRQEEEKEENNA